MTEKDKQGQKKSRFPGVGVDLSNREGGGLNPEKITTPLQEQPDPPEVEEIIVNANEEESSPVVEEVPISDELEVSDDTELSVKDVQIRFSKKELEDKYFTDRKVIKKKQLVHLDEEVFNALDKWHQQIGKGAKSELVNDLLTKFFKSRGMIDTK